jgi:putative membrane protein
MTAPTAGASIIVDVTVELVTQIVFLLGGLAGLAAIGGKQETWAQVLPAGLAGISTAVALLLALRFGMLQLIEMLIRQIAKRGPNIGSFDGLESAARGIARARGRLFRAGSLHMVTWMIGAVETWLVLRALGHPVGPAQALVIESLGMAARSAGFAVPGALGVQEGGFMLACAAFGVPQTAGLSLSLIKRVREVLIGILGLALWRWPAPDHSPSIGPAGI